MTLRVAAEGPSAEGSNPLGIRGESIHAASRNGEGNETRLQRRRVLFALQREAQSILWQPDISAKEQNPTCWCHRTIVNDAGRTTIFRTIDGSGSRIAGLATCGKVWNCPVCCAKIAEERRLELSRAMAAHVAKQGEAYLLTFTFPHERSAALADNLAKLDKARQRFQNSRTWKAWKASADRVGAVTGLEVTLGHNGWHPHLHMLVFTKSAAFNEGEPDGAGNLFSETIFDLKSAWVSALQKAGLCERSDLEDALKHALNVRGGKKAAEYVAKVGRDALWGMSSELTRSHSKTGSKRVAPKTWHYTPFQLLSLINAGEGQWIPAFREYVAAFHGKRMLTWTPGLKAHFDIRELDDEDLAAEGREPKPEENWVASLDYAQFVQVTACAKLGELLYFVAKHGGQVDAQPQVDAWIKLECRRAVASGDVRRRGVGGYTPMEPANPAFSED